MASLLSPTLVLVMQMSSTYPKKRFRRQILGCHCSFSVWRWRCFLGNIEPCFLWFDIEGEDGYTEQLQKSSFEKCLLEVSKGKRDLKGRPGIESKNSKCQSENLTELHNPRQAIKLYHQSKRKRTEVVKTRLGLGGTLSWSPWGDMRRLTLSRTSRNSSLRRYLMPSRRQPIWPVTCDVIWAVSSFDCSKRWAEINIKKTSKMWVCQRYRDQKPKMTRLITIPNT